MTAATSMTVDLADSGLTPEDIGARDAGAPEFAAIKVPPSSQGYVIPYYQPTGERLPFYRIKLFGQELKYKQAYGTTNHIYFPKNFKATLDLFLAECKKTGDKPFIIITEGEKKAAATCKYGIPCCALGGVDSWRNRTVILPPETKLESTKDKGAIRAKLPTGSDSFLEDFCIALGMQQLVDALVKANIPIIIIYDTDEADGLKMEVQRAASQLAHQFIFMGISISNVCQAILPYKGQKVGLDDYLLEHSKEDLSHLCREVMASRHSFPRHPNPRALINGKLQKGKLNRKEVQEIALTVLSELDARGRRLRSTSDARPYYFDETTFNLMPAQMLQKQNEPIHESPFGKFLYREYGLSSADSRVLGWLAAQFTGEDPIEDVEPRRILAIPPKQPDEIALQISDSHFVVISGDPKQPIRIFTNGHYGLLFEQEQVEETISAELEEEFHKQLAMKAECWWLDIFKNSVNLNDNGDDNVAKMAALLYYISPWLLRWRGTQLPIELIIGEAGSGKSSLYELRLSIITGEPLLRNIPSDLKDWFASIVNTGGLHVIDNVQFTNKDLRQRLSDEMAQPLDAQVLTPTGFQPMRDIKPQDIIIDPEGNKLKVLEEYPQGIKQVYEVVFSDGTKTECCEDHLWFVQTRDDLAYKSRYKGQVLSLKRIMSQSLRYKGKNQRLKWLVPNIKQNISLIREDLDYSTHSIIDPYVLGCLLGDGCLSSKQIWFANIDSDIVDRFEQRLPENCYLSSSQKGSYYLVHASEVKRTLGILKLLGTKSRTKFIPDEYLYTSALDRRELLKGLMDTDGSVNKKGIATFSSLSKRLAEGVQFLARSLGGRAGLFQRRDGAYQVTVSTPHNPFSCQRKAIRYGNKKCTHKAIVSITPSRKTEVKCITVDSKEGLYITDNFISTHNCRIITEPKPHIEMRRLYSTTGQYRLPINTVFAMTAIQQPFYNADLIQRSAIFELGAIGGGHDSNWVGTQLDRFGGRTSWLAHHLVFLHRFLRYVREGNWDDTYKAEHRLGNYEQCLQVAAKIFGIEYKWIAHSLVERTQKKITEADWTLEGLKEFAMEILAGNPEAVHEFGALEIAQWAEAHEEHYMNSQLTNSRSLGRYLTSHQVTIQKVVGITAASMRNNRKMFKVGPSK